MSNIWSKISENGIYPELDENEKKRIRIMNRLVFIISVLSIFFFIVDLITSVHEGIIITLCTIIFCTITFYLINRKKYNLAKWMTYLFIIINISAISILGGKNSGTIIFLIPGILFPTIIFQNKKIIFFCSFIILCNYILLFWINQNIAPTIILSDELKDLYQFIGMIGVMTLVFLMIWYFRSINDSYEKIIIKKNQNLMFSNEKINNQKLKLEIKNKEITDSINYASRIQHAILPPENKINNYLKNNFILYLPKDIVAGDFYWMEEANNLIHFAVADCTGHGVPGAMVSVVCNNALNRSIREYHLEKPSDILAKTRELVIESLDQGNENIKDGMDIAFCTLDINKRKLQFSGANNPLIIIRNNEIIEIKGDRQPIGKHSKSKEFPNHIVELNKHDSIYLFTDGFQDQFGGVKGKKLKLKGLKEILLSNADKSMRHQKNRIEDAFNLWKDDLEQIDDVCIMGFKV